MSVRFSAVGCTDAGRVKDTNQDSYLIEVADTPLEDVALAAVADGMGGLRKGELASATAVRHLATWFEERLPLSLEVLDSSVEGFQQFIEGQWAGFVQDLNLDIMRYGLAESMNLGTTLTAMLALGARYSILHVGDSRIYEITDAGIEQLTEDQTFIRREIEAGRLTEEKAERHPQRNALLQCIGSSKEIKPQVIHGSMHRNATYLLCSDGFRHALSSQELREALKPASLDWAHGASEHHPKHILQRLVATVISRKERDNITAVLLSAREEG